MNLNQTKIRKTVYLFLFLVMPILANSQDHWTDLLKTNDPTFLEMKEAFNNYWEPYNVVGGKYIENGSLKKAYGWKQFKRWEEFTGSRLLPNGEFPKSNINMQEFNNYFNAQQNSNFSQRLSSSVNSSNWTYVGSNSSGGGYAGIGRLNCIAFHPTSPNTFWVGSPAGGLWKTTNSGTTWTTNTDNSLPVLGVSGIVIDYNNPDIMYIATGDGESNWNSSTHSVGVLKTTDGGTTWNTTGLDWSVSQELIIRRLLMDPNNSQILFAATKDGIWRTTDGGSTWTRRVSGFFRDLEFKPGNSDYMYASTHEQNGAGAKIFRSTNNGLTWTQIHSFSSSSVVQCELAVTADNPSLVEFIAVNPLRGMEGLYRSTNSGASYTKYLNGQGSSNTNFLSSDYDASGNKGQGTYDLTYLINPNNEDNIWIGGINTWESTDGGNTWNLNNFWHPPHPIENPNNVQVIHADKHFHAYNGNKLYECNDGGLYVSSDNGASWTDISNGLGIGQIYRIGTSATTSNNVICGLQDNGSKEFTNGAWEDVTGGDGMECIIDYTNSSIEYATYVNGLIYKTTDGWNSSTIIAHYNGTGVDEEGAWVTPYVMHPNNHNTLIVGKSQIYQTTDGGSNWTQLGNISSLTSYDVISLAYAPSDPQTIYFSEESRNKVYKTSNGGSSWSQIPTSPGFETISYITVDPNNPNRLWVTKSGYVSNDKVWYYDGSSWTNFSGTLPNVSANCIVYENGTNDGLYVGTDLGVFHRDASMSDWNVFMTGLPNVVVRELEISYLDSKIWAGTYGRGLWESPLYNASGPLAGCTDASAVNYNPNADVDDGSCCYNSSFTLNMYDSYGDGWNGNTWTATSATGGNTYGPFTFSNGSYNSVSINLPVDCYIVNCNGGLWQNEVSWSLELCGNVELSGGAPYSGTYCFTGILGCTDPLACNYNSNANTDDGSCILPNGCTDYNATNYDPAATCDDGSCIYSNTCAEGPITGLFIDGIIDDRVNANFDNMNTYDPATGAQICRVDQIRINYRPVGTSAWSSKNIASPTGYNSSGICNSTQATQKPIRNLTLGTTYEWRVKVWYCSGGNGGWVDGANFTTADECPNVANLTAYGSTPTRATFDWDASNGVYEFARIKSRIDSISNPQGSDWFLVGGFGVPYGTNTKNKNGLTPGETYRGQARTWCDPAGGAYNSLSWTPLVTWTQPTNRIEGGESIKNLDIYPNPSRDVFNISFTSEFVQDLRVRVINVVGEELIVEDLQQFVGEYTKQIKLKDNAKGIYLLEIETNEGVINKKLILQ